ncbi:thymidylate synthase [Cytobacillus sp. Hz8]|uniref:thymidylate synthase n=1 Tax=Cytobacillus sp. Hz8 TaxID=3347168 RepID=UPI0035E1DE47
MKHLGIVETIGVAWMTMLNEIVNKGNKTMYTDNVGESKQVKEIVGTSLTIKNIVLPDPIIEKYMVQEEYDWMENNFTKLGTVKELFDANSYASKLYNYMSEKDQIDWLVSRLKCNLHTRAATITTFEPLSDEEYIPCVSMIDFYVDNNRLDMYVYCRSLDFGCKAYVNLVMLYKILKMIADNIDIEVGDMNLIVKSAHFYDKDKEKVYNILNDYNNQ